MIEDVMKETEDRMNKSVEILRQDLASIRTGRASPKLVERVMVDYYGTPTPLNQIASIAVPEARLLTIRPWDPKALPNIEKAILASDLGLTPNNDGTIIRLVIPQLTEERRHELSRIAAQRVEEARVAIRNCRRDAIKDLQELEREKLISEDEYYRARDRVQELTDEYIEKVNEIGEAKEAEIMEV
ncbi:MAG: ribosome recycling factor [Chloroflexi bacterium]|nr:MAG: ribosome recycling factor [Chloroflexota bacterium]